MKPLLDGWSPIDMEVGVFSYSEQSIADAKERWKEKAESTEKQEEHSESKQNRIKNKNPEGENLQEWVKPINYLK